MLGALDDPYSTYLDPAHREITEADLRGAFDGIGVQVEMVDEQLRVVQPLEGSSGQRAGLQTGDVITHVDGRDIKGLGLTEAIRLIRGPRGTSVVLTMLRGDGPPFDLSVAREEVRVSAVRGEVRPDGIAYIRITNFTQRVGPELRQTLDRLSDRPRRGIVLDLRGNPGGFLDGAVAVASQFIEDRVVLYEQRRGEDREEIRTRGSARAATGPMVVLVDKGTASASEIVAAALPRQRPRDADGRADLRQGLRAVGASAERRERPAAHRGALAHAQRRPDPGHRASAGRSGGERGWQRRRAAGSGRLSPRAAYGRRHDARARASRSVSQWHQTGCVVAACSR
jgi:C-terminal peptidase prc